MLRGRSSINTINITVQAVHRKGLWTLHRREQRRTLSRCCCQHIPLPPRGTGQNQEAAGAAASLPRKGIPSSSFHLREKAEAVRPGACPCLAQPSLPARPAQGQCHDPGAERGAGPEAGAERRLEPRGRAWRGRGRSARTPFAPGPFRSDRPRPMAGRRWLPGAPRTVTCLRDSVVRPLPRQASLRHGGRRSLGSPSAAGVSPRRGPGKERAPRRKATSPRTPPPTREQGSFEENLALGNLHRLGLLGMRSSGPSLGLSGFSRDSEGRAGCGAARRRRETRRSQLVPPSQREQAPGGGPAGGRRPRRWLPCFGALTGGQNWKTVCEVPGRPF